MTANQARHLADRPRLLAVETGGAIAAAVAILTLTSRPHPADPDRVLRLKVAIMEPRQ